ncbi:hypothetical protein [uncultured Megasphaera sp.]|uniref:hypothetical protein n=1 Tax=uncultured Megasphaera sp. TaxID=165188 RepID=UPI002658A993|nr:hypothetical protein [uncultured Megasphaera sp.]
MEEMMNLAIRQEVSRCLLCYDAPCTAACHGDIHIDRILRALYFQNVLGAFRMWEAEKQHCHDMTAALLKGRHACLRSKIDQPVNLLMIAEFLSGYTETNCKVEVMV